MKNILRHFPKQLLRKEELKPTIHPKIKNFTTEKQFNESKGNAQLVDQKTGAVLKERREIYTTEKEFHKSEGNAVLVDEKTGIILQFKGELHTIEGWKPFSEEELLDFLSGAAISSDAAGSEKPTILTLFLLSFKTEETQCVG